jgi:hypothetical protein
VSDLKMQIIFTKSNRIASKLIRNVTKEDCSHVALSNAGFVIHSNFTGCRIDTLQDFLKHSDIVHSVEISYDREILHRALTKVGEHSSYDFGGMAYLWLRSYLPFLPKKNLWQSSGLYLCTEFISEVVENKQDSMITPYKFYLRMKERYTSVKLVP